MARQGRAASEKKSKGAVETVSKPQAKPATTGKVSKEVAPPAPAPSTPQPVQIRTAEDVKPAIIDAPAKPQAAVMASIKQQEPDRASNEPNKTDSPASPPQPPLLFEIGWEVCWQLGGIYTVLRTKADCMIDRWDDRYCLIGPYNPATAALEFEERPSEGIIRDTLDRLRAQGIP